MTTDKARRNRKERGRPLEKLYAPRVDATPEDMAQAMFALPAGHRWENEKDGGKVYSCVDCGQAVNYPDTLYQDGRCEDCEKKASAVVPGPKCTCGIEIAKASRCSEPDCFYRQ